MFRTSVIAIIIILILLFIYHRKGDIFVGIISGTIVYLVSRYINDVPENSKMGGSENTGKNGKSGKPKKLGKYTEKEIYRILNDLNYTKFRLNQHPEWCTYNDSLSGKKVQLELDLYSEDSAIAIEYNGPQHYSEEYWDSFYKYAKYVQNSNVKKEICRENGVELITIPFTVENKDLKKYIKSRLLEIKIIRDKIDMTEKDWKAWKSSDKYLPPAPEPKIQKINEINKAIISRELNEIYE